MHGAPVVPQDEVAYTPVIVPNEFFTCRVGPQLVKQQFRLRKREAVNIGVAPSPEVQQSAFGFRMSANERMKGTVRCDRVIDRSDALPDVAATVIGSVML
jgi:hypothetical protein